jgi:hypothetical protein
LPVAAIIEYDTEAAPKEKRRLFQKTDAKTFVATLRTNLPVFNDTAGREELVSK